MKQKIGVTKMAEMSREEAIKVIQNEKECVKRGATCIRNCQECELVMPEEVIVGAYDMAIEALSQPEIIHCAECKHRNFISGDEEYCCGLQYDYVVVSDNDFCSWAERRTNE